MSRLSLLFFVASLASTSSAVLSTFDGDAEGWHTVNIVFNNPNLPTTVNGAENADWTGDDGVPAGSLLRGEPLAGVNDWRFFSAPAAFLGDKSDSYGSILTYDTKSDASDGVIYPGVILQSGTTFLFCRAVPPPASWTRMSIPLVGVSWTTDALGVNVAGEALLRQVLGGLDGLYIDADWYSFPTERAWLDNVNLPTSPVPEPVTLAGLGLAGLATARRRKPAPAI